MMWGTYGVSVGDNVESTSDFISK